MPKNKGKGGKNRRRGKNENEDDKRELVFREDGQEYAQVIKMLGNGRLEAQCFDGEKRLAHIRGKMRKKVWINQGDIILLSLRDFQDDKADVIVKYTADEARSLKAYGELPDNAKINETDTFGEEDGECNFEFGDEGELDIDEIWGMPLVSGWVAYDPKHGRSFCWAVLRIEGIVRVSKFWSKTGPTKLDQAGDAVVMRV